MAPPLAGGGEATMGGAGAEKRRANKSRVDAGSDGKMACWKQYTILAFGSAFCGVCNIIAISVLAAMEPMRGTVTLISWGLAIPSAFIIHFFLRTIIRALRKRRA
jgi:hypothetical protein